jgi:hypothetical protein
MLLLYRPKPRVLLFDSPLSLAYFYRSLTPQCYVAVSAFLLLFWSFLAPTLGRSLACFMVLHRRHLTRMIFLGCFLCM